MVLVGCLQAPTKVPEGLPFGDTQTSHLPWLSWRAGGMEGGALITVGGGGSEAKVNLTTPMGDICVTPNHRGD